MLLETLIKLGHTNLLHSYSVRFLNRLNQEEQPIQKSAGRHYLDSMLSKEEKEKSHIRDQSHHSYYSKS